MGQRGISRPPVCIVTAQVCKLKIYHPMCDTSDDGCSYTNTTYCNVNTNSCSYSQLSSPCWSSQCGTPFSPSSAVQDADKDQFYITFCLWGMHFCRGHFRPFFTVQIRSYCTIFIVRITNGKTSLWIGSLFQCYSISTSPYKQHNIYSTSGRESNLLFNFGQKPISNALC